MGARFLMIPMLLLALAVIVNSQSDEATAPPPINDNICEVCICKDDGVDCTDKKLETYFSVDEWSGLKVINPILVDLSNNNIINITKMAELPIVTLNLSRNSIENIQDASFMDLQQIKTLDLSHNRLTVDKLSPDAFEGRYSPEAYEPLSAMRTLILADNDFHSLDQDIFKHLPLLTELDLSGNPLQIIDHLTLIAVSSLYQLQVLNLRDCQIKELPQYFLHTPRFLEHLDLSRNQLTAIPQELEDTKNLKTLNLNENPIVRLDNTDPEFPGFPRLDQLERLHMCNMPQLTTIGQGTLGELRNLRELHMSYNERLSFIHPKALARFDNDGEGFAWIEIKELYLQSNNLSAIDRRLVARWELIDKLDVSGNPYLCDCSTQWMVDDLVTTVVNKQGNASTMVCQEPIEMRGYTLQHLHDISRTMRCVDKYGNRPERDGAILFGTLIGVLLAVPIMLGLVLLWRKGYFGWMGLRGPSEVSRAFYKRAPLEEVNYI